MAMRALYVMNYLGSTGIGAGVLYIGNGQILGTDVGLSRYEGTYVEDGGRIRGTAAITATAPGSALVTGAALPSGGSLPISVDWPADFANGSPQVATVGGQQVQVALTKIGDIR